MVRDYKRRPGSRQYVNYTSEQLDDALQKVAEGSLSMRAAAKQYKIPFSTINNRYHGRHVKTVGGQSAFTKVEEIALLNSVAKCSDWGFPLTTLEMRMFAKAYLDKQGRSAFQFENNLPGKDWVYGLLKRHKTIVTQRISANINKARAAVSRDTIIKYFHNLEDTLRDVPAQNIFNYDETNVSDDPGKVKGIYRRGVKYPEKIANHSKSATTIMVCGSADGTLLPLYVIYKSEHLYNTWKENGPKGNPCCSKPCCAQGCRFNRTSHGWMDSNTFHDWFESTFLPHARRLEGKKVLIGDNLASHFNDEVIRLCEENNIAFVCLVANSTHICQPLDVAFFKPMKVAWRATLTSYKMKNSRQAGIPKDTFPKLLKDALDKMNDVKINAIKSNLISGFEATGIYPLNSGKVLQKLPGDEDPTQEANDTLTKFLQEKRYGDCTNGAPRRKKTRLTVEPGKSVGTAASSSSDEEQEQSLDDDSEDNDNGIEDNDDEVEYIEPTMDLLVPGAFVLAKFLSGKRKSVCYKYVCKVNAQFSENEYTLMGLKSVDQNYKIFRLVKTDISTVSFTDIIAMLPKPNNGTENTFIFPQKVDVLEL